MVRIIIGGDLVPTNVSIHLPTGVRYDKCYSLRIAQGSFFGLSREQC